MAAYALRTCVTRGGDIDCFSSELHGDGVRVVNAVEEGAVIFEEKPLLFLQTLQNKSSVMVCSKCSSFIGSEDFQLSYLKKKDFDRQKVVECLQGQCSSFTDIEFGDVYSCHQNCGELYCSDSCRSRHWSESHQFLCTGAISEDDSEHPLLEFKRHAVLTNEIFLLCGEVFAQVKANIASGLSAELSLQPFANYVRNLWWNCARAPPDKSVEEFQSILKSLVAESFRLLSEALKLENDDVADFLSIEYMSRCHHFLII